MSSLRRKSLLLGRYPRVITYRIGNTDLVHTSQFALRSLTAFKFMIIVVWTFCLLTTQAGCSHPTQLETTGELLIGKPELVSDYCFNHPIHLERRIGISTRHTLFARIDIRLLLSNDITCWEKLLTTISKTPHPLTLSLTGDGWTLYTSQPLCSKRLTAIIN